MRSSIAPRRRRRIAGAAHRLRPRVGRQFGDILLAVGAGTHPVAVVVHGGFWLASFDLSLMVPLCEALAERGIATWNIEYRRPGDDGGGWPGTFVDVGAAVDHLPTLAPSHGLDLGRVGVFGGRSPGAVDGGASPDLAWQRHRGGFAACGAHGGVARGHSRSGARAGYRLRASWVGADVAGPRPIVDALVG